VLPQGLRKPLAEQHQDAAADEHNQCNVVSERAEIIGAQSGNVIGVVTRNQHDEHEQETEEKDPEQPAAHGDQPRRPAADRVAPAARIRNTSSRRGSSFITRLR
jgi:hypothetical protein